MSEKEVVLVTGGSGFVGSHCILQLLQQQYRVRTTVRNLAKADSVREQLIRGGATKEQVKDIAFFAAELTKDEGWVEACSGCTYVLHVASPFPAAEPKDENDLIVPAREGTLRALRAAKAAGSVKRVVVTSSVAAIAYGHPDRGKTPFTEEDWTNTSDPSVKAYPKSKTVAERAAWDYIAKEGGDMQLAVVNPVGIFGPVYDKNYASSIEIVVRLMNGQLPGCPNLYLGVVDVRDVAALHLLAMARPEAAGQRYIAVSGGVMSIRDMSLALKSRLGAKAKRAPTRTLPDFVLRLVALVDKTVALIVPELSHVKESTSEKAKSQLGWEPRSPEDALVASAESLGELGLLTWVGAYQSTDIR